jgi:dTDP-glucose 4,6-dehydratase
MKVLITGGTGFVGAHFTEYLLGEPDWEIYSLERLTPQKNKLGALAFSPRVHHLYHDFTAEFPDWLLQELDGVDYIVHMGAEVHGLRSLGNPELFVRADALGTFNMLEAARKLKPRKFIYVSTAETLGETTEFKPEDTTMVPTTPYAAAKATGEILSQSYRCSFGVPALIVRSLVLFGERQGANRFVPTILKTILDGKPVSLHVGPEGQCVTRHFLHIREFVKTLYWLLQNGQLDTYHVIGPEKTISEVIGIIGSASGRSVRVQPTAIPSKSHAMRFALQDTKLAGVYCTDTVNEDLEATVKWYKENEEWLR